MKIIICDDEKSQLEILRDLIHSYAASRECSVEILEYSSCENLWWDLQDGLHADLLLLDIQMQSREDLQQETGTLMNGMELAHQMRNAKMFHRICFITGIRDYVFEGYEVEAAGYLLKPYTREQLYRVLDKTAATMTENAPYTVLDSGREMLKIYHQDVVGLEASLRETKIYMKQSVHSQNPVLIVKKSITECMELLKIESLRKIQRSYAVNLKNIARITKEECIGEDGTHFPMARGQRDVIMKAFIEANRK